MDLATSIKEALMSRTSLLNIPVDNTFIVGSCGFPSIMILPNVKVGWECLTITQSRSFEAVRVYDMWSNEPVVSSSLHPKFGWWLKSAYFMLRKAVQGQGLCAFNTLKNWQRAPWMWGPWLLLPCSARRLFLDCLLDWGAALQCAGPSRPQALPSHALACCVLCWGGSLLLTPGEANLPPLCRMATLSRCN